MKLFGLIILLFFNCNLFAKEQVRNDSSAVVVRSINKDVLQKLKQDSEFKYTKTTEPAASIWEKFWDWVWYRIDQILSTKSGRITIWSLLIIVALAVIGYFIVTVSGMNKQGLFARRATEGLEYSAASDDIHTIAFDEAISRAASDGNFRLALRLLYLQSLKILSDRGYILWEVNKTNNDYLAEVSNSPWKDIFKTLTRRFEYAWYGEVNIQRDDFERLQQQFQQFNNKL